MVEVEIRTRCQNTSSRSPSATARLAACAAKEPNATSCSIVRCQRLRRRSRRRSASCAGWSTTDRTQQPSAGQVRQPQHARVGKTSAPGGNSNAVVVQQSCNRAATAIPGDGVQAGAGQAAALQLGAEHALTRPSHPQPRPLASQKGMHAGARPARAQPQPQQTMASIGWTVAGAGPAVAAGGGAVAGGGLEAAWVMGVPVTTGAPIETDVDVIGTPTAMVAEVSIAIGGCPCQLQAALRGKLSLLGRGTPLFAKKNCGVRRFSPTPVKIPVWWRRAVLPSLLALSLFLSFFHPCQCACGSERLPVRCEKLEAGR